MITFEELYTDTMDLIGVSTSDTTRLAKVKRDINSGLKLFQNAARRYWTEDWISTDLVASQQYYQLPSKVVRVTEVKVAWNGLNYPLKQIASEYRWNQLNVVPTATIQVPTYFFIRGYNEIGLWPQPSMDVTAGLVVSYEPRLPDMTADDYTTGDVSVTNGSTAIVGSGTTFTEEMVGCRFSVTDGSDGLWYKIASFTDATHIALENDYEGLTSSSAAYTIADTPFIPEEYHIALEYYAAGQYYLKRKDMEAPADFLGMFDQLLEKYKDTYGAKTTNEVISDINHMRYNIFSVPPNAMTDS